LPTHNFRGEGKVPDSLIIQGDARHIPLANESVQCVVTSPPYWDLRDYKIGPNQLGLEPTPELYVQHIVEIFREVGRVLRKDGTCWINLGDSYCGSWGNSGQRPEIDGQSDGQRKKSTEYLPRGGWDERREVPPNQKIAGLKPKDLVGIPWRVAFALQADGWWLRSDIIWAKPNPMPESVMDRPTRAHEYLFLLTKSEKYYWDQEAVREAHVEPWRGKGEHESKTPHSGRLDTNEQAAFTVAVRQYNPNGRNIRTVWTIATQPFPEAHFATFPEKLVEPCVLAGSREGDWVLDPFAGSGTVGVVCARLNRRFVGIELSEDYCKMAVKRIAPYAAQAHLPLGG